MGRGGRWLCTREVRRVRVCRGGAVGDACV